MKSGATSARRRNDVGGKVLREGRGGHGMQRREVRKPNIKRPWSSKGVGRLQLHKSFVCGALPVPTDTGLMLAGIQDSLASEPGNALSLPTWVVHTSSVIEWIVAIQLVLNYARVTGKREYNRLAYGMLPLHASSMCAVTYHFFYNAPALSALVTLQAGLTCFGNVTLLLAAYSIYDSMKDSQEEEEDDTSDNSIEVTEEEIQAVYESRNIKLESDSSFLVKATLICVFTALVVKYGSLLISLPFNPSGKAAAVLVVAPTVILGIDIATKTSGQQQPQ